MRLSQRIRQITDGGSGGWDLYFRARAMRDAGLPVTELTIGDHDTPTHPGILAAMDRSARAGNTGYSPIAGNVRLRGAIAARTEAMTGVCTKPENVLVTAGGQAALLAAHLAVLDPGDQALFIDPYYATNPGTIRASGGVPVAIGARSKTGFQPTATAISAVAEAARSLLINTPNNPTGVVYTYETLLGIADTVKAHNLWLISDEVYDSQIWEGTHLSPRALPDMAERTLVVNSMSKTYAMTGFRIGWIIGPPQAIRWLTILATHSTYGVAGFVQDAALFALENSAEFEPLVARPFRRRRDIAKRIFSNAPGLKLIPTAGAMYVMLDIRQTGLTGVEFAERLLEEAAIAVMPGESFGASAAGHIRIALTRPDEVLEAALHQIARFAALCPDGKAMSR